MMGKPQWSIVADSLSDKIATATPEQRELAERLGIQLDRDVPSAVAAVILRYKVAEELQVGFRDCDEIPAALHELEDSLGVSRTKTLVTNSREELSAWYSVRYTDLTIRGLRDLKPVGGDVVRIDKDPAKRYVVSSVGRNGRVYMRGNGSISAWPNHVVLVSREGCDADHPVTEKRVLDEIKNNTDYGSISSDAARKLSKYKVGSSPLPAEAIRRLEELLESDEKNENRYQELIEEHPVFLRFLVSGNWVTYVIPKQKFGSEYVTDFLVMGLNSHGPQWVAVELESPRHDLLRKDGHLRKSVTHAVDQIEDWREWLTGNVAYAQGELGLAGITNRLPGVVIVGRDDIRSEREPSRSRVSEEQNIQVHSWDWLLRHSQQTFQENAPGSRSFQNSVIDLDVEDF